jgi:hypothetical protein
MRWRRGSRKERRGGEWEREKEGGREDRRKAMRLFAWHGEVKLAGSILTVPPHRPSYWAPASLCACAHGCPCSMALPFAQWGTFS